MKRIVVLNLLFRPDGYSSEDLDTIARWLHFFQERGFHVIATPPAEQACVFEHLSGIDKGMLTELPVLSFDTCDRWRAGLREARSLFGIQRAGFAYLWSADYRFDSAAATAASALLNHDGDEHLVVGTIQAAGRKHAIDEYGTFPLLEAWFPEEHSQLIAENFGRPRSELIRISDEFMEVALGRRWYPTEQTVYLILQAIWDDLSRTSIPLAGILDDDDSRAHPGVVEQIERMELWFKYVWRDRNRDWNREEYLRKSRISSRVVLEACRKVIL